VKHIRKNPEPPSILTSLNVSTYKELNKSEEGKTARGDLRKTLSQEQGYICCYCCRILDLEPKCSHIEHLRPQESYSHLSLEYNNLLVSCQGKLEDSEPRHCGMAKDAWFDEDLMVSPLSKDCEEFFEYSLAGEILPTKDANRGKAAQETIDRLQLNIPKLQAMRQAEIAPLFDLELSTEEVLKLIESFATTDDEGYYQPFGSALIHLLKLEYSISSVSEKN
jgi:uncharacterized protein (TIGR02646 family)